VVDFGDQPLGPWGALLLDFGDALEHSLAGMLT
jgi:hypothetical protein